MQMKFGRVVPSDEDNVWRLLEGHECPTWPANWPQSCQIVQMSPTLSPTCPIFQWKTIRDISTKFG